MTLAERIRTCAEGLGRDGTPFSYRSMFRALGAETEDAKTKIRSAARDFLKRGEFERVEPGVFRYRERAPRDRAPLYQAIWRAMRMRERWTAYEMARLTGADTSHVYKYSRFLACRGLIERSGKQGNQARWRITMAGRDHRQTPYPSQDKPDPYRDAKEAGWRLIRLLAEGDLASERVRTWIMFEAGYVARCMSPAREEAS